MKKAVVVLAVVMGLALTTSVYAQKWIDMQVPSDAIAKGKPFKFTGEVQSVDPKSGTAVIVVGKKMYIGNFGFAKFEGSYKGVADLKPGDKVTGEGVQASGQNWVTKMKMAEAGAKPEVMPKKD
ncbi:MAG TPA: hypothetical protein VKF36_21785 [Syntrophorhabdales bacterium]|nr:hypothetical protein [Syntrophorhabdales bacterium]